MNEKEKDFNIEVKRADQIRIAMDMLELAAGGRYELYNLFREERIKMESELLPKVVRCLN